MRKLSLLMILFMTACGLSSPSPTPAPTVGQEMSTLRSIAPTLQAIETSSPSPEPEDEDICVLAFPGKQDTIGLLTNPYDQQELHTKHIRRGTRCEILDLLRNVDFPIDERGVVDVFYAICSGYKVYIYTNNCE